MNELMELYIQIRDEINTMIEATVASETEGHVNYSWRGAILGEKQILRMVAERIKVVELSNEQIAQDLELIKADIEWDHDIIFQTWLDNAIRRLRKEK